MTEREYNIHEYHEVNGKVTSYFRGLGYLEVPTQSERTILAACEDPETLVSYEIGGEKFALPQSGQMAMEFKLLQNPSVQGLFCQTTSYRDEPHIITGRHDYVFPLVEFETHGDMTKLAEIECDLLRYLGFNEFHHLNYEDVAQRYGVNEISSVEEMQMWKDYGSACLLKNFPQRTHPFWNMLTVDGYAKKIDVILSGMETIGSAERSCDPDHMRKLFYSVSDGKYAQLLFQKFDKARTLRELDAFLALPHIPRCGGGIGMTRLIRSLRAEKYLDCNLR